jgi:hypothetical protein
MAGSADLLLRCYTGIEATAGVLRLNPALPPELRSLEFGITYRQQRMTMLVTPCDLRLTAHPGTAPPVQVQIGDRTRAVRAGEVWSAPLAHRAATPDGQMALPGHSLGGGSTAARSPHTAGSVHD